MAANEIGTAGGVNDVATIDLAFTGLTNLVERDIYSDQIAAILKRYPELKQDHINSAEFQALAFLNHKTALMQNSPRSLDHEGTKKLLVEFPFLKDMMLKDTELQEHFRADIQESITFMQYFDGRDADIIKHIPIIIEKYQVEYISEDIKISTRSLLLEYGGLLLEKTYDRNLIITINDDLERCLEIIGGTLEDILLSKWKKSGYDPLYIGLSHFPKEHLEDPEIQDDIFEYTLNKIGKGWSGEGFENFVSSYSFVSTKLEECKQELLSLDFNEDLDVINDRISEDAKRLLESITAGWSSYFSRLDLDSAEEFIGTYSDLEALLSREILLDGVVKGLKADQTVFQYIMHADPSKNILEEKKRLVEHFPLPQEEAEAYLIERFEADGNHGYATSYYFDVLNERQAPFEGMSLDRVFQNEKVRAEIIRHIKSAYREHIAYDSVSYSRLSLEQISEMESLISLSENEINEVIISATKDLIQAAGGDGSRGYNLFTILTRAQECCKDFPQMKAEMESDEVKELFHQATLKQIPDPYAGGSIKSFGSDDGVKALCELELFTLNAEEIESDVLKIFFQYLGAKNIRHTAYEDLIKSFVFLQKKIENEDTNVVEAAIGFCLNGVDPLRRKIEYYDLGTLNLYISIFIDKFPFMKEKWGDEQIQQALSRLSQKFLSEGHADESQRVENWKNIDHFLKDREFS